MEREDGLEARLEKEGLTMLLAGRGGEGSGGSSGVALFIQHINMNIKNL